MWKYFLLQFICALAILQRTIFVQNCALLDFYNFKGNTLFVEENNYVNLTFWLNTSACNQSDMVYRIKVQTLTNVGSWEYDGRIIQMGNNCTEVTRVFAGCFTPEGPGRLYKIMNQSHLKIEWTWTWKDVDSEELATASKQLNLQPAHPPEFVDKYVKIFASSRIDEVRIRVKAHTTAISGCDLIPLSSEDNTTREVTCFLTGSPPNLVLSFHLEKESNSILGIWMLTLRNSKGSAHTTLHVIENLDMAACTEKMKSMSTSNGWNADGLIDGDLDFSNTRTTQDVITEDMGVTDMPPSTLLP